MAWFAGMLVLLTTPAMGQPPTELEFTKWSGSVNIPDPVAISFDPQGRAYVTQTVRRKAQDLDIRAFRDWIPHDVGFQTVDDKRAFYRRELSADAKPRIEDRNKDGVSDYRDLMVLSEKIHRVVDHDGDGEADEISLFAEGFQTEVTGIAAGVLWHAGKVYTTIAPDVWALEDRDGDGRADSRNAIAHGFGVHVAYAGHDMHGLTVGPDGKIYWSIGDKGISVTVNEGARDERRFHFPNQGGVMRCNPDGSDFEVFAHGLRNVQELAFDQFGNLFGVDNDSDQPGERERFVYIVQGMDAGWRCNYQYRGGKYNPWMDEKLCVPYHPGQAAYVVPPISHSINGPAGFTYNPGTALGEKYRDYFFLTGAPNGEQIAFKVQANGASFVMKNSHQIGKGIPLVGINFGPDGALYGVDWGGGYPLNQKGAIWKIDVATGERDPNRERVRELLAADLKKTPTEMLADQLGEPDQRIRLNAQFELVNRRELETLLKAVESDKLLTSVHAVWGLGQLGRLSQASLQPMRSAAAKKLASLLRDSRSEVRTQAAKTLGDLAPNLVDASAVESLIELLSGGDPRAAFHAGVALRRHAAHAPADVAKAAAALIVRADPSDVYLRHAAMMALSGVGDSQPQLLGALARHEAAGVRVVSVVALRSLQSLVVMDYLNDADPKVAREVARAIYDDFSIEYALPMFAKRLPATESNDPVVLRRMIGANYRIGDADAAMRVATFAASEAPAAMRNEALAALTEWLDYQPLDRVTGRRRDRDVRQRAVDKAALQPLIEPVLLDADKQVAASALRAIRALDLEIAEETLRKLAGPRTATSLRLEALNSLAARQSKWTAEAAETAAQDSASLLQIRGLELLVELEAPTAFSRLTTAADESKDLAVRQRSILLLAALQSEAADAKILSLFQARMEKPAEQLELIDAMKLRAAAPALRDALAEWEQNIAASTDPLARFEACLDGGDAALGEKTFRSHLQVQCSRCHRVGNRGSTVGPNLKGIAAKRDAKHLLRSIVAPSADIEPKYRTQVIRLDSGKVIQGLLLRKTDEEWILANAQGKEVKVPVDSIEASKEQSVSIMPEVSKSLSHREIRDVLAYLKSLKKK